MSESSTTISLIDYSIFCGELSEISIDKKVLINTLNQYSFCMAEEDFKFKEALQASDVLLPDGIAIVKAVKLLTGRLIKKIAGADVHLHLLKELNKKGGKCFYLGSSENTLLKIRERLSKEFPAIQVQAFPPPHKLEFSELENKQMIETINACQPDVLFIGMTAPKQEIWAHFHKEQVNAKIICSVGAAFDFYAGTVKRPSPFWIKLGLEWFIRLIKEPRRMWKRYLYYGPVFVGMILRRGLKSNNN